MFKYSLIAFLTLFLLNDIFTQKFTNKSLENFISNSDVLSKAHVGISVYDINDKKEVLSYNSKKHFIPASVLKLFYTLAAIDTKGDSFQFKTKFYYTGSIYSDGTLEGDLLIFPSGDPTFGSKRFYKNGFLSIFNRIKGELETNGIKCIEGDIIVIYPNMSYPINGSWTKEDIGNYYGGGSWPLNINENEYELEFKLGSSIGDNAEVSKLSIEAIGTKILNYVKMEAKGSGDNSYIHGSPESYVKSVKGTLPIGSDFYTIKGTITNPPSTFLRLLGDYFYQNNFYYNDIKIYNKGDIDKTYLFEINSPQLINIVKLCNDFSINLYSEALSQLLCLKTDAPNDYLSKNEIELFFKKYNLNFNEIQIVDGCGLSSDNILSPKIINKFILDMINKIGLDKVLEVLPQAGKDGYAKGKFKGKNIWLKSGSISGVLNYSGVIKTNTKTNKYVVFSVMVNNIVASDNKAIKNILKKLIVKFEDLESE